MRPRHRPRAWRRAGPEKGKSRVKTPLWFLASSCVGLVACGPPDVKYETRFLEIAPYFDFPICEGTARVLDEHVAHLANVMKVSPVKKPLRIYWGQEGVSETCPEGADGCYSPGRPGTVYVSKMST